MNGIAYEVDDVSINLTKLLRQMNFMNVLIRKIEDKQNNIINNWKQNTIDPINKLNTIRKLNTIHKHMELSHRLLGKIAARLLDIQTRSEIESTKVP